MFSSFKKRFMSNRSYTNLANKILENFTPPALRDSRWFCTMLYAPFLGDKTQYFFSFRENAHKLSPEEYTDYYKKTAGVIKRESDVGTQGIHQLTTDIINKDVLEVGCGHGFLAKKLSQQNKVTAVDIIISDTLRQECPAINFREAPAEHLPFSDGEFEITVCTHTLEHVLDFEKAIAELRRVTSGQLYIIVPLQRPARYTPDLHISFFPYPESFLIRARPRHQYDYKILDNDLYYTEDLTRPL